MIELPQWVKDKLDALLAAGESKDALIRKAYDSVSAPPFWKADMTKAILVEKYLKSK